MSRATTKEALIQSASQNYEALQALVRGISRQDFLTEFDFSDKASKKEAHWARDKNLRDIYVHLYEWHQLLLNWFENNTSGKERPFLPSPYNWKTYGQMNQEFWQKHQDTPYEDAQKLFEASHTKVMELAEGLKDEQLFTKGYYPWVGSSTLGSYFVSTTASHYDWAMKKVKAHIKKSRHG